MKNTNHSKIGVLQFTHPGGEHSAGTKLPNTKFYIKQWNYKFTKSAETHPHSRKYIRINGKYICDEQQPARSGSVDFWGEWEPNSISEKLSRIEDKDPRKYPENIAYPIFIENTTESARSNDKIIEVVNSVKEMDRNNIKNDCVKDKIDQDNKNNLQNTDPFVFGDHFYYTCCKQEKAKHLKEGSVILFGTCYGESKDRETAYYAIDTVFVIKEIIPYDASTLERTLKRFEKSKSKSERLYYNTVLKYVFRRHDGSIIKSIDPKYQFDIIIGASFDDPYIYNGQKMYSFFPCHESSNQPKERLSIVQNSGYNKKINSILDQELGHSMTCAVKNIVQDDIDKTYEVWNSIKNYALNKRYYLGIKTELPRKLCLDEIHNYLDEIQNKDKTLIK